MKYNLLILTDHSTHTASNSLYALAKALRQNERCGQAWICSRGIRANDNFFSGKDTFKIYASKVNPDLAFSSDHNVHLEQVEEIDPTQIDLVVIRMPQPLNIDFFSKLETCFPKSCIVNHPRGILETSSKGFLVNLQSLCPPMQLCHSPAEAIQLSHDHEIVLKPMYSYGGRGMIRLSTEYCWKENDRHPVSLAAEILGRATYPMLAMRFLKNVVMGDKRIVVANKKILGASLRYPAEGQWICNVAAGGHAEHVEPGEDELRIEAILTPLLYDKGIILYGFDTLVNDDGRRVLSEINTLSIGGLMPMEKRSGRKIVKEAANGIWDYFSVSR